MDGDRMLLARRAYAPWEGMWGSPGGFCEVGEHPIETVVREVLEETGLHIEVTGYLGVWVDSYADAPEPDADVINVAYYLARPTGTGGEPDPAEVSEIGWFAWHDLPSELAPPGTLDRVFEVARDSQPASILDRP
jgi:8-oxo-dGTP diphosphatase